MFTDEDLLKGGKRVPLEYIASQDKSILIPKILTEKEARRIDPADLIVRADHGLQFTAFHGVFETINGDMLDPAATSTFGGKVRYDDGTEARQLTMDEIISIAMFNSEIPEFQAGQRYFQRYCSARKLDHQDVKEGISILFQRIAPTHANAFVFAHPHSPEILILDISQDMIHGMAPLQEQLLPNITQKKRQIPPYLAYNTLTNEFTTDLTLSTGWKPTTSSPLQEAMAQIVKYYQSISHMPKFNPKYVLELEVGIRFSEQAVLTFLLQVRQGRRIEIVKPFLTEEELSQKGVYRMTYVVGCTPGNGEVLEYRDIDTRVRTMQTEELEKYSAMDTESTGGYLVHSVLQSAKVFFPNSRIGIGVSSEERHGGREDTVIMPVFMRDQHTHSFIYSEYARHDRRKFLVVADGFNGYIKPIE